MADINLAAVANKTPLVSTDKLPVWPTTVTSTNDLKYVSLTSLATYVDGAISDAKYVKVSTVGAKGDLYVASANDTVTTLSVSGANGVPLVEASGAATGLAWGQIASVGIASNAVITDKILDLNVTTGKINNLAVTTGKINDLAVTTAKINDLAVTTGKINDLAVTTGKINDLAVTTGKIDNLAVTTGKIANEARTSYAPTVYVGGASIPVTHTHSRYTRIGNEVFGTINLQYMGNLVSGGSVRIKLTGSGIPVPIGVVRNPASSFGDNGDIHCGNARIIYLSGGAFSTDYKNTLNAEVIATKNPAGGNDEGDDIYFIFSIRSSTDSSILSDTNNQSPYIPYYAATNSHSSMGFGWTIQCSFHYETS